ncbi:MAG: cysteine desulfurase [Treponema sp.]|nr:cysteine desulfurase [Treponema sp.]
MNPKRPARLDPPRHYFDWAATSMPDDPRGGDFGEAFGNPSSMHREGRAAKDALEAARAGCARVLGVPPETLYFTSGGTEANCIPLYSTLARQGAGRTLASMGEHSSIGENLKNLERLGRKIGLIPVDSQGRVTPALLSQTLEKYPDTRFAAIMAVNNETGTINDMAALRAAVRGTGGPPVHLHCDMAQAVGKIPLDIAGWDVDSASLSGHKIGGPRGVGLLYLRKPVEALCLGGGQERRVRSGTENVAGAAALAACLENRALPENLLAEYDQARLRCRRLLGALREMSRCRLVPEERGIDDEGFSPYIVQAGFRDVPGEVMARALDDLGFAVSTGAACSFSSPERPVLAAMGVEDSLRLEGIRVSQGWSTGENEIDGLLAAISEVLKFL